MSTILIIDDDDQLRRSFERLLTDEGYEILCAPSGETGIKTVHSRMPDLVILDMRLPGMNGFETFKALQRIDPKLPVVIMTAYGTIETAVKTCGHPEDLSVLGIAGCDAVDKFRRHLGRPRPILRRQQVSSLRRLGGLRRFRADGVQQNVGIDKGIRRGHCAAPGHPVCPQQIPS